MTAVHMALAMSSSRAEEANRLPASASTTTVSLKPNPAAEAYM